MSTRYRLYRFESPIVSDFEAVVIAETEDAFLCVPSLFYCWLEQWRLLASADAAAFRVAKQSVRYTACEQTMQTAWFFDFPLTSDAVPFLPVLFRFFESIRPTAPVPLSEQVKHALRKADPFLPSGLSERLIRYTTEKHRLHPGFLRLFLSDSVSAVFQNPQ